MRRQFNWCLSYSLCEFPPCHVRTRFVCLVEWASHLCHFQTEHSRPRSWAINRRKGWKRVWAVFVPYCARGDYYRQVQIQTIRRLNQCASLGNIGLPCCQTWSRRGVFYGRNKNGTILCCFVALSLIQCCPPKRPVFPPKYTPTCSSRD